VDIFRLTVLNGESEDAQQVLAQVQSHDWDLVILDITMPGRSGLDVLKDLKAVRPKLPVLILPGAPQSRFHLVTTAAINVVSEPLSRLRTRSG